MEKEIIKVILSKYNEFRSNKLQEHYDPNLSLEEFIKWLDWDLNSKGR